MKAWQRMALAAALLAALGLTGCQSKANGNAQGNTPDEGPAGQGQFQQLQGTTGVITDISDTSITIAVMPEGQGFGGQGRPSGSGRPSGGPRSSAQPDQGQAPDESSRPTIDTSSWEKKTFTIDSSTKITQMQFSRSGDNKDSSQSTALKVSDIKAGESVNISERSGKTGTADTITVMGRSGFGGQSGRGGQGAPNGQNQGSTGGETPSSSSKV